MTEQEKKTRRETTHTQNMDSLLVGNTVSNGCDVCPWLLWYERCAMYVESNLNEQKEYRNLFLKAKTKSNHQEKEKKQSSPKEKKTGKSTKTSNEKKNYIQNIIQNECQSMCTTHKCVYVLTVRIKVSSCQQSENIQTNWMRDVRVKTTLNTTLMDQKFRYKRNKNFQSGFVFVFVVVVTAYSFYIHLQQFLFGI